MKKLLLILLCLPIIFSCGDKDKAKKLEDRITELETANKAKYAPEYSVSTAILISDDNNTQLGAENLMEGLELFSGKKNLEDEAIILKSYSLTEETITALGLDISLTEEYIMKLEVSPLNDESSVLKLSIKCNTADTLENIVYLNKLTEIYMQNELDDKNLIAKNTLDFLQNEADSVLGELKLAEEEFAKEKDINQRIVKASGGLKELQLMRRVEVLSTMYLEIIKNLEYPKMTLLSNTPNTVIIYPARLDSDTTIK